MATRPRDTERTPLCLVCSLLAIILTGCTPGLENLGNPSEFCGTWEFEDDAGKIVFVFYSSGTFDGSYDSRFVEDAGNWDGDSTFLRLTFSDGTSFEFYVTSGSPASGAFATDDGGSWTLLTCPVTELEGTWMGTAKTYGVDDPNTLVLTFSENRVKEERLSAEGSRETKMSGKFIINPKTNPKEMDVLVPWDSASVGHLRAIYKIDGSVLYWVPSTTPDTARPTSDQLDPQISAYVLVLRKQ